jgi:Zn-dependent protease with chaperone function
MRSTSAVAVSDSPAPAATIYYDGMSARPRRVEVALGADELTAAEDGTIVANWRYADLCRRDAPATVLRVASLKGPQLARLDIADQALAADLLRRAGPLLGGGGTSGRAALAIVLWSLAAAGSLVATVVYVVPLVADRLAHFVPVALEQRLGQATDNQVRALIGRTTCAEPEGRAALAALTAKLTAKASLPMPVEVQVLSSPIPNAFALPGGRIYLLSSLLDRAQSVDEVAGVLAHEMGHVAHRDGLRVLIQNGGTSFLLGLLFGDVLGGGAIVYVGTLLVNSAYSRDAEQAADGFAADVMRGLGRSPRPLGVFLGRLVKEEGGELRALAFLQTHPPTDQRLAALSRAEPASPGEPLLSESEWQSLRAICRRSAPRSNEGQGSGSTQ